MNVLIQNILAASILILALWYVMKKFLIKPSKKNSKSCGTDDCGCH
nr:FeoB-associated Cys-rich membrane protein [uncultured Algibacter sp.]